MHSPISEFDSGIQERDSFPGVLHGKFHGVRSIVQLVYKFVQFLESMLPNEEDVIQV